MGKQFICGGTKYELAGPNDDVIGLPVILSGLPETVVVEGVELTRRPMFHVSLVCPGRIAERHALLTQGFVQTVVADFCSFVATADISFAQFTGEFRFVESEGRKTLVGMCDIMGLREFFEILSAKHAINFEYPPTHVTLYTLGGGPGVFLTTSNDIQKLTKVVSVPEIATLPL